MIVSNAEYHADPAVSASHLHAVAVSPYHYWSRYRNPKRPVIKPTKAMRFGSLDHCATLEPDELSKRYGVCGPRNTKAGKEQAAELEAAGIEAVSAADMETALAMAASVRSHPVVAQLLRTGQAEQSFWWDDLATGLRCKCRPDWMAGATLVDLKTTTDASPRGFAKSVAQYRYHVQDNHYRAGTGAERFLFIAVEKTYPYACAVYELDIDAMVAGENARRRDLSVIADCMAISEWPGYGDTIQTLSLPGWALNTDSTILTSDDF
ncbi:MAG: PD-(D/E)XK nuclease-like domain-containing protein [Candidatus Fonsibacter ubiquis]